MALAPSPDEATFEALGLPAPEPGDDQETVAVFRRFRDNGAVIALFPEIDEGNGCCSSYMHVGQHSSATYAHVLGISDPCAEDDLEMHLLIDELVSIGYNLNRVAHYPPKPLSDAIRLPNVASGYDW